MGELTRDVGDALSLALLTTFLFVLFRFVFRKPMLALAALVGLGLVYMPHTLISESALVDNGFRLLQIAVMFTVVLRAGMLAQLATFFCLEAISSSSLGFTLAESWGNAPSTVLSLVLAATALTAAWVAVEPADGRSTDAH